MQHLLVESEENSIRVNWGIISYYTVKYVLKGFRTCEKETTISDILSKLLKPYKKYIQLLFYSIQPTNSNESTL